MEKGKFGFVDQTGGKLPGSEKLLCEMTLRDGNIVYDLNGMSAVPWEKVPPQAGRGQTAGGAAKK
jgi:dihydroorotase